MIGMLRMKKQNKYAHTSSTWSINTTYIPCFEQGYLFKQKFNRIKSNDLGKVHNSVQIGLLFNVTIRDTMGSSVFSQQDVIYTSLHTEARAKQD